jgi:hypothetical protein
MEQLVERKLEEESEVLEENIPQCYFVSNKTHIT